MVEGRAVDEDVWDVNNKGLLLHVDMVEEELEAAAAAADNELDAEDIAPMRPCTVSVVVITEPFSNVRGIVKVASSWPDGRLVVMMVLPCASVVVKTSPNVKIGSTIVFPSESVVVVAAMLLVDVSAIV
jgi:hypothetical protein